MESSPVLENVSSLSPGDGEGPLSWTGRLSKEGTRTHFAGPWLGDPEKDRSDCLNGDYSKEAILAKHALAKARSLADLEMAKSTEPKVGM